MFQKHKPIRDKKYLKYIKSHKCSLWCINGTCDPHHLWVLGTGIKCDDWATVPLCRRCHTDVHEHRVSENGMLHLHRRALELLIAWHKMTKEEREEYK